MHNSFDTIIIGGGHAGTEAALAAARVGVKTLLLTQNLDTIGQLSCNPAVGGIGKSHLVREIDALGGIMAQATDQAGIHFRVLNTRKGAAVRATRAQVDRILYRSAIQSAIFHQPNLQVFQGSVEDLVLKGDRVIGVRVQGSVSFFAPCVVLTTGTFLGGRIHLGTHITSGGRAGEPAALPLAERLRALPLRVGRLKTGTPPRVDGASLNWSLLQVQPGDQERPTMSYLGSSSDHPRQVPCHITHTNTETHEVIAHALPEAPLFSGQIEAVGPRYCPSIEDKVHRFPERNRHQIFIEPEGLATTELYLNGMSTSLPPSVQHQMLQTIKGFESVHITRYGYAIEYDFLDPRDLHSHLESRLISGLFLAGQINGTTGYEEAAAQGLLAGLNAARCALGEEPQTFSREQSYIGVMVDDLRAHGVMEPYRMFTSRAEHRLRLREDNADLRLTLLGRTLGLVDDERWCHFKHRRQAIDAVIQALPKRFVQPGSQEAEQLADTGIALRRPTHLADLLKRPEVRMTHLLPLLDGIVPDLNTQLGVETHFKYEGYINRQEQLIKRLATQQGQVIPADFNFAIKGLSTELRVRLAEFQPPDLGAASRLPGMTPAALSLLAVRIKQHQLQDQGRASPS